jgi:predicted Fe-Mo cluster-binding NifX family protein
MKIAFGADGNTLESKVARRFGHAEYYVVYDTETDTQEAIENTEDNHSHSVLYKLLVKGTKIFIVGNIGPHAYEIVKSGDAKIFLARNKTLKEALGFYQKGELKELYEPTVKKSISHTH